MHKVRARNFFEQDPERVPPAVPFAHLLDDEDTAYSDIVQALADLAFELDSPADVDESAVALAIRIGRARHHRRMRLTQDDATPPKRIGPTPNARDGYVYYIRRGAMVKIGTTVNLRQRMSDLRPDEVLAVEPGSYQREAEMHRRFQHLRVPGQREWFYAGREIQDHVESVLDQNGPPPTGLATLPEARDS